MTFASLPALPGAAAPVLADLSAVSRAELAAAGRSPEDAVLDVVERIRAHGGHVILSDGIPVAIYGFVPFKHGPRKGMASWFLAGERFFSSGPAATLFARKTLASHASGLRSRLYCVSASPHPDARRWLGLLGFVNFEDHGTCFISQFRVLRSAHAA